MGLDVLATNREGLASIQASSGLVAKAPHMEAAPLRTGQQEAELDGEQVPVVAFPPTNYAGLSMVEEERKATLCSQPVVP